MNKLIEWVKEHPGWEFGIFIGLTNTEFILRRQIQPGMYEVHPCIIANNLLTVSNLNWQDIVIVELERSIQHFESTNQTSSQR
jgi:hypothetical protein